MLLLFLQEWTCLGHTGLSQILAPFTVKKVQDFLDVASVNTGHLHQKGMKGKSTSTPGLDEPSERAVRAEASCCICFQLGWDGMGRHGGH